MLKKWIREYIMINKREILIIVGLILLGIIVGVGVYIFSTEDVKQIAISEVKEVLDISKTETYVKTNIIVNGLKTDVILIFLLAILSITLFGKWIIYAIALLKGAALSIYAILLFKIFGPLWGIVVALLLLVLVNILYIPAFIYLVVTFLEINFNTFKTRITSINTSIAYRVLLSIALGFILMFSSLIVEQISSGVVLKIYNKM